MKKAIAWLMLLGATIVTIIVSHFHKNATQAQQVIEVDPVNHRQLVFDHCRQLGHYNDVTPLTDGELRQFRNSVQSLNYDETLQAVKMIEPPCDESHFTPSIVAGAPRDDAPEAWELPAEGLADRLLELAPIHTIRLIQRSQIVYELDWQIKWRGATSIIKQFGENYPELAWQETLYHYKVFWELADADSKDRIPAMANGIFHAISLNNPKLARQFLLEESYQSEPYAEMIQHHALTGILRAIEYEEEALIGFLEWRLNEGANLYGQLHAHNFRLDLSLERRVSPVALALLARLNPQRAIYWAEENAHQYESDFKWPYAIYAGWVQFWPYTIEGLDSFYSRQVDAIQWLAENSPSTPEHPLVHNAYFDWLHDDEDAAKSWLKRRDRNPHIEKSKDKLRTCPILKNLPKNNDSGNPHPSGRQI